MKNWNSKTKVYYDIVGEPAKELAQKANTMKEYGLSVETISKELNKSRSRIYQYLRKDE